METHVVSPKFTLMFGAKSFHEETSGRDWKFQNQNLHRAYKEINLMLAIIWVWKNWNKYQ